MQNQQDSVHDSTNGRRFSRRRLFSLAGAASLLAVAGGALYRYFSSTSNARRGREEKHPCRYRQRPSQRQQRAAGGSIHAGGRGRRARGERLPQRQDAHQRLSALRRLLDYRKALCA